MAMAMAREDGDGARGPGGIVLAREDGEGARGPGGVVLAELGGAVAEAGAVVSRLSSGDAAGPGGADPVLWLASAVYALGLATLRGFEQVLGAGAAGGATVRGVRARVRVNHVSGERRMDYGTLLDHLCGGGVETVDLSGAAGFGDGLCSAVASCVGRGLVRRVVDVSESGLSLAGLGALAGSLRTNETCGVVCHGLVDCKQLSDVAAAWGGQMEAGLLRRVDLGEVSGTRLSEDELVRLGHLLASQGLGSSVRVRVGVGGGGPGEGATAAVSAVAHAGVDVPVCDGWSWTSRELVGPVVTHPADGARCDLSEVGMSGVQLADGGRVATGAARWTVSRADGRAGGVSVVSTLAGGGGQVGADGEVQVGVPGSVLASGVSYRVVSSAHVVGVGWIVSGGAGRVAGVSFSQTEPAPTVEVHVFGCDACAARVRRDGCEPASSAC